MRAALTLREQAQAPAMGRQLLDVEQGQPVGGENPARRG